MTIVVTPLSDALGAQISGVDLSQPLTREHADTIYRAWLDHLVIVIRGQDITPEDQQRVCRCFGSIGEYHRPREMQNPEYASDRIMLVSNIRVDGKPIGSIPDGEMMWHTDTAHTERPHKATTLYAVEVPDRGGNTLFTNQYAIYESLPAKLKDMLAGKLAMNVFEFGTTVKSKTRYDRSGAPHHAHPVLRKHPETGRTSVFACPLMTEEIIGLEDESEAILDDIYARYGKPEFTYTHRWQAGDFVMWDNRCTMHAREDFPRDQHRLLRRVTIADESPVLAA